MSKQNQASIKISQDNFEESIKRLKIATLLQFTLPGVPSIYYGDEIGMQGFSDPLNRKYFDWDNINYDIFNWYSKLGDLRKNLDCLKDGEIDFIYNSDKVLVYSRFNDNDYIIVAINQSDNDLIIKSSDKMFDYFNHKKCEKNLIIKKNSFVLLTKNEY